MKPAKYFKKLLPFLTIAVVLLVGFLVVYKFLPRNCGRDSGQIQFIPPDSPLIAGQRIKYDCLGKIQEVKGVILHYTDTASFEQAMQVMENRELFVQIMIDRDGKAYQITDQLDDFSAGATGANAWAINIEIVGNQNSLETSVKSKNQQFQSVVKVVKYLSDHYKIPPTNIPPADINSQWQGIFSHEQIDQLHPRGGRRGKQDPGEAYMKAVLDSL